MFGGWWGVSLVIAVLGLILSGALARGNQSDPATPVPVGQATPETGSSAPLIAFAPTEGELGYFALTLTPGQAETVAVRIANVGNQPERLATYAADVYTRVNGGSESRLMGEPTSGATRWLDYPHETIDLEPGQEITRGIIVTVPEGTPSGEYTSSIVIQNADPIVGAAGDESGILHVLRQVIAVAITVPGPRQPALEVGAASYELAPAYASVLVTVANSGNVRLKPTATLVLTEDDGTEVTSATSQMDTFFPGTEADLELQLVRTLDPGQYHVAVSLEDAANQVKTESSVLPMTIEVPEETPVAATTITISSVEIDESRDADGILQFVEAVVTIDNPGMQVANARLTLHVTRDGEPVEDLVLGSSLTFPAGPAEFRQRYFPMGGWTPGVYAFAVTLDSIDPNNDQPVALDSADAPVTVSVS